MADRDPQAPPLLDRLTPTRVGAAAGATFFAGLVAVLSVSKGAPVWLVVVAPLVVGLGVIVFALSRPVGGDRGTDAAPFDREPGAMANDAAELRSAAAEARTAAAEALAAAEDARRAAGLVAVPSTQAPGVIVTTRPADHMTELQIELERLPHVRYQGIIRPPGPRNPSIKPLFSELSEKIARHSRARPSENPRTGRNE